VNVAVYFSKLLTIFDQKMANFSALGMRPHPHAVYLWLRWLEVWNAFWFDDKVCDFSTLCYINRRIL